VGSAYPPGTPFDGTVINWCGDPIQHFGLYSRVYHEAAKLLVRHQQLDVGPQSDFEACPVVFLYRHALELRIKSILSEAGRLDEPFLREHDLRRMLPILREIMDGDDDESQQDFARIKHLVDSLCTDDPKSYAFRYPVDTRGGASLRDHFTFRVTEFAQQMDGLLDMLEAYQCEIAERRSADPGDYSDYGDYFES
jgi:hypothetical protein